MTATSSTPDVNHIDPRLFPPSAHRDAASGELLLGKVPASTLLAEFGSPLYVIDEQAFCQQAQTVQQALRQAAQRIGSDATVYYAAKAFLCVAVAKWVAAAGLSLDVASGGELQVALAAGVAPARIGFHGNNKSPSEITQAVTAGVGTIILDSEIEIARVAAAAAQAGVQQRVRLRVNSGVHASTHDFLATAHEDQKFGMPLSAASALVRKIVAAKSLKFVGLHCHIGSQIFATAGFRESAKRLIACYAELAAITGEAVPELNLGGGFGIAYTPATVTQAPDITEIAAQLADIVAASCQAAGIAVPHLAFEPGRLISGQAGVTLYTVGTTKTVQLAGSDRDDDPIDLGYTSRVYLSVDGGMSDNARPALYGADYHVRLANRVSQAPPQLVRVVGKHCESGDIVVYRDELPADVQPGDVLAVAVTGAYCWSLASNYNYVPRPPVVAVADGAAQLIVHGESEADLLARSVQ